MSSPYARPGFYDEALAKGRHRDIVGGRWDETGRAQMAALMNHGLRPDHVLLDIGAGALRLGCKAVPYLEPGHYWGTDASRALMLAGYAAELDARDRLDPVQLVEDADFTFAGVTDTITHAIAFGVFPHLESDAIARCLNGLQRFPHLECVLMTVFLAPKDATSHRQKDGVVTHAARAPYHLSETALYAMADASGWRLTRDDRMLPRGQVMFRAEPLRPSPSSPR
ncbi:class I SAM-dependent methyltransferase [Thioclava sp. JE_KL1]|uniref:class I SAM-dependent methyltransferase n=1 Tax=Thioclava sp. JE_KL1 TaxID=2651187 RepID=UPI0020A5B43E|nr:class I SAM-dependent methyltransferase [Thioclava sp. JE_KL1]